MATQEAESSGKKSAFINDHIEDKVVVGLHM